MRLGRGARHIIRLPVSLYTMFIELREADRRLQMQSNTATGLQCLVYHEQDRTYELHPEER